jgi:hypothetical protein
VTAPIEIRRRTPAEIINRATRRLVELLNAPDAALLTQEQRLTLLSVTVNLDAAATDLTEPGA